MSKSKKKKPSISIVGRQGDVLMIAVGKIPQLGAEVPRDKGRVILAYGEVTGHAHAIETPRATLHQLPDGWTAPGLQPYPEAWQRALHGPVPAVVRHEEHGPHELHLPSTDVVIRRQREYSPEELRAVAD